MKASETETGMHVEMTGSEVMLGYGVYLHIMSTIEQLPQPISKRSIINALYVVIGALAEGGSDTAVERQDMAHHVAHVLAMMAAHDKNQATEGKPTMWDTIEARMQEIEQEVAAREAPRSTKH